MTDNDMISALCNLKSYQLKTGDEIKLIKL